MRLSIHQLPNSKPRLNSFGTPSTPTSARLPVRRGIKVSLQQSITSRSKDCRIAIKLNAPILLLNERKAHHQRHAVLFAQTEQYDRSMLRGQTVAIHSSKFPILQIIVDVDVEYFNAKQKNGAELYGKGPFINRLGMVNEGGYQQKQNIRLYMNAIDDTKHVSQRGRVGEVGIGGGIRDGRDIGIFRGIRNINDNEMLIQTVKPSIDITNNGFKMDLTTRKIKDKAVSQHMNGTNNINQMDGGTIKTTHNGYHSNNNYTDSKNRPNIQDPPQSQLTIDKQRPQSSITQYCHLHHIKTIDRKRIFCTPQRLRSTCQEQLLKEPITASSPFEKQRPTSSIDLSTVTIPNQNSKKNHDRTLLVNLQPLHEYFLPQQTQQSISIGQSNLQFDEQYNLVRCLNIVQIDSNQMLIPLNSSQGLQQLIEESQIIQEGWTDILKPIGDKHRLTNGNTISLAYHPSSHILASIVQFPAQSTSLSLISNQITVYQQLKVLAFPMTHILQLYSTCINNRQHVLIKEPYCRVEGKGDGVGRNSGKQECRDIQRDLGALFEDDKNVRTQIGTKIIRNAHATPAIRPQQQTTQVKINHTALYPSSKSAYALISAFQSLVQSLHQHGLNFKQTPNIDDFVVCLDCYKLQRVGLIDRLQQCNRSLEPQEQICQFTSLVFVKLLPVTNNPITNLRENDPIIINLKSVPQQVKLQGDLSQGQHRLLGIVDFKGNNNTVNDIHSTNRPYLPRSPNNHLSLHVQPVKMFKDQRKKLHLRPQISSPREVLNYNGPTQYPWSPSLEYNVIEMQNSRPNGRKPVNLMARKV